MFKNCDSEQVKITENLALNRQLESESDKANPPVLKPDLLQRLGDNCNGLVRIVTVWCYL